MEERREKELNGLDKKDVGKDIIVDQLVKTIKSIPTSNLKDAAAFVSNVTALIKLMDQEFRRAIGRKKEFKLIRNDLLKVIRRM